MVKTRDSLSHSHRLRFLSSCHSRSCSICINCHTKHLRLEKNISTARGGDGNDARNEPEMNELKEDAFRIKRKRDSSVSHTLVVDSSFLSFQDKKADVPLESKNVRDDEGGGG